MSHQTDKQQRPFLCARALAKSAAAITVKIWGVVSNERAILAIFVGQRYRSAIGPGPAKLLRINRGHWTIEDRRHYVIHLNCDEHRSRIRTGHGPENAACLRPATRPEWGRTNLPNPPNGDEPSPATKADGRRAR